MAEGGHDHYPPPLGLVPGSRMRALFVTKAMLLLKLAGLSVLRAEARRPVRRAQGQAATEKHKSLVAYRIVADRPAS